MAGAMEHAKNATDQANVGIVKGKVDISYIAEFRVKICPILENIQFLRICNSEEVIIRIFNPLNVTV